MFEKIKKWYELGLWTSDMVKNAVKKNVLTNTEAKEIVGGENEIH